MICSWKVLWSTVLTFTPIPVDFVKLAITFAYAFLGTGSDALEPNVTVPALARVSERAPVRIARAAPGP